MSTILGILCFVALVALCMWVAIRADLREQSKKRGDFEAYRRELDRWEKECEEMERRRREQ